MATTNFEVSFKKIHALTLIIYLKIYTARIECKALVKALVTFNIFINYIFPENVIEIHQVSQKICIFTSLILTIFINLFGFVLPLLSTKKLMTSASIR